MNYNQLRRQMIIAMGSRCSECGEVFDPDDLIIHHVAWEHGQPLGYGKGRREVFEWARTGKIPEGIKLLCDDCNRKKHGYRPSKRRIFDLESIERSHRSGETNS